jgi:hypothetical protein
VAVSEAPGAQVTLRFRGDQAGSFLALGPDAGDLEVAVDGGPWQPRPCFEPGRPAARSLAFPLVQGLDPAQWHELRLRVAGEQPAGSTGRVVRLGAFLVSGELEDPYAGMAPLQRLDALYAAMDPLQYTPPADRWQLLPRTMARLRGGGTLKDSGKVYGWFRGDAVHANERGSQLLARLLEAYFRPKQ